MNILTSAIIKRKQPSRNGTKLIENGEFTEYFQYTPAIRKLIYTTNTVEGYHRQVRKVTKNKGVFPSDTALEKLVYFAYRDIREKWTMPLSRDSITKCKIFVLNSHHIFDARDLMADWGWGFTNPQPLPNPILSRAKGNFQLAIQKKETEVSLRLTNFVLHMYKQLTSEQRSQIFALLQKEVKRKELASYCRHKMKYNRHVRPNRTTKVKNIPDRVSIHQRPAEADGTRFGDWEMDTMVGKDGKGAILTLTERSTNMILMERLPEGKHPEPLAKVVVRLLFPYRKTIRSITTDNGSQFCAHKLISKGLAPKGAKNPNLVFFADSYCSWQKGSIENANKLIRQYIPKGTDFSTLTDAFVRKILHKINRRPRKKLNFETPKDVFFRQINNFAVAG